MTHTPTGTPPPTEILWINAPTAATPGQWTLRLAYMWDNPASAMEPIHGSAHEIANHLRANRATIGSRGIDYDAVVARLEEAAGFNVLSVTYRSDGLNGPTNVDGADLHIDYDILNDAWTLDYGSQTLTTRDRVGPRAGHAALCTQLRDAGTLSRDAYAAALITSALSVLTGES